MYTANPHFSDTINHRFIQSEIEGGVHLNHVQAGTRLEVRTRNHLYTVVAQGDGQALISGHPDYCPEPTPVRIHGSTWGGRMLKAEYIGRGMHLEFQAPDDSTVTTSRILEIQEFAPSC